jgi:hypothetical protein
MREPEPPVGPPSAGDPVPQRCELIEVHVAELKQLFNSIDPSPFREKDLDPGAEDFIVGWAREARSDRPLALRVHVDRPPGLPDEPAMLREAVQEFFRGRAVATRSRLRRLFHIGRVSLLIGIVCLGLSLGVGGLIDEWLVGRRLGAALRESLLIGGWVAMWRPLETFLYDWWPIRAEARLFDRLSVMPVRIVYSTEASADAWRGDWPAVPPGKGGHAR